MTPYSKEAETYAGTSFTLSCEISGLSKQVTKVVWEKNGTDVTTLTDGATYTPDTGGGSYDNNTGTQTSTLTVSGSDSARDDMEFVCVVTDPGDVSTTVNATVYWTKTGMYSINTVYRSQIHKLFYITETKDIFQVGGIINKTKPFGFQNHEEGAELS